MIAKNDLDELTIALRAYAECPPAKAGGHGGLPPSPGVLVFDTETEVDAAQQLRLGAYQLRWDAELVEVGLFYDPASLR